MNRSKKAIIRIDRRCHACGKIWQWQGQKGHAPIRCANCTIEGRRRFAIGQSIETIPGYQGIAPMSAGLVTGDGTGGLERGRTYMRTIYPPSPEIHYSILANEIDDWAWRS